MDNLCNSLNSGTVIPNPLSHLLVFQVLNVLKKDATIQSNLNKHCTEIYNIMNDETLAIHEQKLENIKIKTELASSNTTVEEMTTVFEAFKAYDKVLNDQVLHITNKSVYSHDDWHYDYYEERRKSLDTRIETNKGRLTKFEDNTLNIIKNISAIIQEPITQSQIMENLKASLQESENYIKQLQFIKDEYDSIYSVLFSEIKYIYKVSKVLKSNYDKLNVKNILEEFPNPKDVIIDGLKSKLNENEANLKICRQEADAGKLLKDQKALNDLLYVYYRYDDTLTGLNRALIKCDVDEVKIFLEHGFTDDKIHRSQFGNTQMHTAAKYGCTEIILWIASKDRSLINEKNKQGQTPLHLSVQNKHHDATLKLIQREANVNALSNYQGTPLHIAAQNGDEQMAKLLIDKKAKLDTITSDLYTPLHVAAENNHLKVARLLIDKKAKVNALTKQKFTPLHISARNGNLEMTRLLLQHGASLNVMSIGDCTPLHEALNYNKMEVAKFIINTMANKIKHANIFESLLNNSCKEIEDTNVFQRRVKGLLDNYIPNREEELFKAVRENDISLVRSFLKIGANPSPKAADWYQGTPLLWATSQGFLEVVKLLLNGGAKVTEVDTDGTTALHWAVDKSHIKLIQLLLDHDAPTETHDSTGRTPLSAAIVIGNIPIIQLLLSKGANPSAKNQHLKTLLHIAAFAGKEKMVELLVDAGAELGAQDDTGSTALHYAAYFGHFGTCLILVNKGAPLEVREKFGRTPLHYAASQGHLSVVKLLVQRRASLYARDSSFNTPAQLAELNNKYEVAAWLDSVLNG